MSDSLIGKDVIAALAASAAGLHGADGNPRVKQVVNRLLVDLMVAIDELDISMDEFWTGIAYLTQAGKQNEFGLIVPGVVLEHFLDLRLDEAERRAGITGGTARTIEGPLYIAGAPLSKGEARLDDGTDDGQVLFMEGQVRDILGKPISGAIVDVWHANTMGNYSHFDPTQAAYNLRRRIETDEEGRYRFRSIMPSGYACPRGSQTEKLLKAVGRHGNRPAHVHFFITSPGHRKLTTQINIDGDKYLYDDFAFGTRSELIPVVEHVSDARKIDQAGLNKPFARIRFDFTLAKSAIAAPTTIVNREHAEAA
ncbi:catechol 1,2-dioxygenase [Nordella sp. HKS 07]|uniref:catechol 1,2-dioxygenase n=1 Tax=Nordella sp. HKS 07 TaxID=2712222 RepID=UPI0013E183E9|nr:catechol 1,2-dioxygenase [Nordella sp. HKS 07]QIG47856.1 catechol 1,2-dioxygenase [Nordella sp. HKS 07]